MTLGTAGVRGDGPNEFDQPTAILVAPDGNLFVTNGHGMGADRVMKLTSDGDFIKAWGSSGSGPGQFNIPHALALDSQGRLFVGDRNNARVQIFDQEGELLDIYKQYSRISGLFISDDDTLYAIDSESDDNYNPGWRKGLRVGSALTGDVWYFVPEHISPRASGMGGVGSMGEGVTADAQGNVIAGEVGPIQGLTKFIKVLN